MQYFIQFNVYLYGNQVQHLSSGQVAITFLCVVKVLHHSSPAPKLSTEKPNQSNLYFRILLDTWQNRFPVTRINKYDILRSKCVFWK